jgi:2,3-diaminopropionate biosynthesis protein SbnA
MPIFANPLDLLSSNLFVELDGLVELGRTLIKLEGYNVTGSIKIKPALFMMADLERRGVIAPNRSTIVESSSGNLGIALALICRLRGYGFICVTDPNISLFNRRGIEAYGGRVVIADAVDGNGGYLEARLALIRDLVAHDPSYIWLNQYANPANTRAHAEWTALEILNECPRVTHLYVGSGTTGTIMGLAERFAELSPQTMVVAVEPEGSVTFDQSRKGRRLIPGIGTSRVPELSDASRLDRIVYVDELDAIRMCHKLARKHGLLLGGSSGSVMAAIEADASLFDSESTIVAVSADLGDKYLDTVYSPDWIKASYGVDSTMIETAAPPAGCEPLSAIIARHSPAALTAARSANTAKNARPAKSDHRYDSDRPTS